MKANVALSSEMKGPVLLHIVRGEITTGEMLSAGDPVVASLDSLIEVTLSAAQLSHSACEDQRK